MSNIDLGPGGHGLPPISGAFRGRDHLRQECADPLWTEKGGNGATLPSPSRSVCN
jgi:hypothetical protein